MPTRVAEMRERLRALGAQPVHERHLLRRWLHAQSLDGGRRDVDHFLPKALRQALPELAAEWDALARLDLELPAPDGGARLRLRLADGQAVEGTVLPPQGLCVSTQVGCAVGCTFCLSGRDGLLRQLGSAEIVAQVVLARRRHPVRKVVFMGIGEPSHNLEQVLEAIDALGTLGGIGHKELVFSTVGDRRAFERLDEGLVKPALALSLHSSCAEKRARLLPRAPDIAPDELVALADDYAHRTGYPVQVQWALLAGVNDGDDELQRLVPLLRGRRMMLNLIPYNEVPGTGFRRPEWAHALDFARRLNQSGVLTRLRRSAAQEVSGGCGQLRARERTVPVVAAL